jgi:hypothetical protein
VSPGNPPLAGFGPRDGARQVALYIGQHDLDRFTEKCVRVLTFWRFREYIEPPRLVMPFRPGRPDALEFAARMPGASLRHHAPGMTSLVSKYSL